MVCFWSYNDLIIAGNKWLNDYINYIYVDYNIYLYILCLTIHILLYVNYFGCKCIVVICINVLWVEHITNNNICEYGDGEGIV